MITNMFSFSFVLGLLINLVVNGQNSNLNALPSNSLEMASLISQFHRLIDNQNQDQPAPVSCFRVRPNIKNAYPSDNTKYFICRDEQNYEIFTCPNGGIFDDRAKACIDLCEQKKPCLNQGQCIILSNLTLQCVCRQDWTGERCEIPLSTCANNPCGPNAECRMLKTSDYSQDYVCVCNNQQTYGRNCQQTVPNPCLTNMQQFHPFAFSRRAYINCDDEFIFFQPCNAKLYWNQEEKRCDRLLPVLLRAPFINLNSRNDQKQQVQSNIAQPTQWQRLQENQQQQQNFPTLSQVLSIQQSSNQVSDNPTQTNQRFAIQFQPWQGTQTIQNQQSLTNTFVETTTTVPQIFHLKGFSSRNSGQQNTQSQNNGNNQIQSSGDFQTQSITQPQSWQSIQSISNQPWLPGQNQQTLTTDTNSQAQMPFQQNTQFGFTQQQQQNMPIQQQSWQNNQQFQNQNSQFADLTTGFNSQNFAVQSQPDQLTASSLETTTTAANKDVQQGVFIQALRGWKPNKQGSFNQIDQQQTLNSIPTFQTGSWKTLS